MLGQQQTGKGHTPATIRQLQGPLEESQGQHCLSAQSNQLYSEPSKGENSLCLMFNVEKFYRLQDFRWKCFIWFWKTSIFLISIQSASWAFHLFLVRGCSSVYHVTVMGQRHCQTFSLRLLTYLGCCREAYGSSKERKYMLNYIIPTLGNKGERFSLKIGVDNLRGALL